MFTLSRRGLLAGAAAAPFAARDARAEEQRVVVATWGGDYANLLRQNVEEPILKPQGVEVVQDTGDEDPRVAKMFAQRRLPRGTDDVICLQAVRGYQVGAADLVETLDETKVPNLKYVLPNLRTSFWAPHIYSPQVLIYNPDVVKDPPKTLTDLFDPKWNGRVGVGDINYFYIMMAAGLAASGNAQDFEGAKKLAEKLNGNGLRLYPSTDSIGAGMKSGEIVVGVMWLARVNMWQNAGIPVRASFPTEGCILYSSGMVVPKNAANKEGAFRYLNAMLQPSAQKLFAERMGYLPTVDNAPLEGRTAEQLAFPTPPPKLVVPDYAVTSKAQSDISEWWKKNIAHA
jgi:putative spermidine/putrescine transport system substrate-binding protein